LKTEFNVTIASSGWKNSLSKKSSDWPSGPSSKG
jgi:hypothetical protein